MAVGGSAIRTYDLTTETFTTLYTGDILNAPYSGDKISITLPAGSYKLECWGAQGGYNTNSAAGGKGGYSVGSVTLGASTPIYIYTGGQGTPALTNGNTATGGFNGGGNACASSWGRASGGGGSDIRLIEDSLYSRVIVAGGGGGSVGLTASMATEYTTTIGHGGGTSGTTGSAVGGTSQGLGTEGTQTSGGTNSTTSGVNGSFGLGGGSLSSTVAGGGGGWYGGAGGSSPGGGSGYVYTSSTASNYPSGCLLDSTHYLTDASTTAGNTSFTSPTGASETGHSGNGYIRITVLSISGGGGGGETRVYDLSQSLVTLTNLIPDGDMELSSWSGGVYDTTTKKYGSRSQHFTAGGTHVQSISMPTLPVVGHKYYGRHYLKTNGNVTADDCRFEWYAGDGVGLNYVFGWNRGNHPDWEMESSILEVTAVNGSSYICRSFTVNASSDVWADGLMIIDLTAAFGAGNEPTQEWCDAHIPFFVGTTYLPTNLPETFKVGDILNVPYTGHRISMMLPKKNMKFECWGAQGGTGNNTSAIGGKGGYSVGTVKLPKIIEGHFYSGGKGESYATSTTLAGGFNGGGSCVSSNQSWGGGAGGGASDVRIGTDSLYSRLITAGGGGGGGYTAAYVGGAGGGESGEDGIGSTSDASTASGGTQTAGGTCSGTYIGTNGASGTFGVGGDGGSGSSKATGGAGGGGWYGGAGGKSGNSANCTPGGGGSGYVYTESTASSYPSGGFLDSSYYLSDAETTGDNRTGNGYITITIVSGKTQKTEVTNYGYTGAVQTVSLKKGYYKLEVWGAEGGSGYTYAGGKGGYSVGYITLDTDTTANIYVGGQGTAGGETQSIKTGGWNGGGNSGYYCGGSGGGGTDIRIGGTALTDRVIVAGGGGGGCRYSGYYGGAGGGESGVDGSGYSTSYTAKAGTQSAGGAAGGYSGYQGTAGSLGQGGDANTASSTYNRSGGGGGGYYGGGGGGYRSSSSYYYYGNSGGGGGSGYVSSTLTNAETIAGNMSFIDPDGTSVTGHSGNGYVRITRYYDGWDFKVKVGSGWKDTISAYVKISGEWKEIIMASTKVDGWWTGTNYAYGTLEETPWKWISKASQDGIAQNLWAVGDTKSITLNGTVGTLALNNETLYAYILGFNHNSTYEESGITFGTFKTAATGGVDVCLIDSSYVTKISDGTKAFNMNHWGETNYGGWKGCDMRYDILGSTNVAPSGYGSTATTSRVGYDPSSYDIVTNPVANTLLSAFPQSLRAVMKPNTIYTDNTGNSTDVLANVTTSVDYLWLLSEYEVFGTRSYANQYEQNYQAQYEYFIDGGSTVKYKYSATNTEANWWERSPAYYNTNIFCYVAIDGSAVSSYLSYSLGLSPAFLV